MNHVGLGAEHATLPTGGGKYEQANFQEKRLREGKFLIVQGNFVRLLMLYGEIIFFRRLSGKCQINRRVIDALVPDKSAQFTG